jgi:methylenetetrahydrofolate dehydrogenase (NADP+)/methenyltetrahydrofolate cyclohydrolase
MPAKIIDGRSIAAGIRENVAKEIKRLKGIAPGLAVVLVGDDPASKVYVGMKKKACDAVGIYSQEHILPEATSQRELLELISTLNKEPRISGILVQLPLPDHIDEKEVLRAVDPRKDVDGFHPVNVGSLTVGARTFAPCTPAGIIELIKSTGVDIKGKRALVVGRSNIVGKPTATLLLAENATVTICHSKTQDLPFECRHADILVVAIGKPRMITGDMIKPGAIVIDVGTNRVGEKKLVGDVDFDEAVKVAGHITPVPGGVGPMTIAMLMKNTLEAAIRDMER